MLVDSRDNDEEPSWKSPDGPSAVGPSARDSANSEDYANIEDDANIEPGRKLSSRRRRPAIKKDFDYSELRKTRKNKRIGKKSDESEGSVVKGKKSQPEVKNRRKTKKSASLVDPG